MKLDIKALRTAAAVQLHALSRYKVIIFVAFIAAIYGYLVLQINQANNVQPSAAQSAAAKTTPHIDPTIVNQLQKLQDNSVSVKALFNEARTNPFQ